MFKEMNAAFESWENRMEALCEATYKTDAQRDELHRQQVDRDAEQFAQTYSKPGHGSLIHLLVILALLGWLICAQ